MCHIVGNVGLACVFDNVCVNALVRVVMMRVLIHSMSFVTGCVHLWLRISGRARDHIRD